MNWLLTFSLLLISITPSYGQTTPHPTAPIELKLVGRGIIDKKTGDSIALACVVAPADYSGLVRSNENLPDADCRTLQFVYFKKNQDPQFVGSFNFLGWKHPDWDQDDQIKYEVKRIGKTFKRWRRDHTGVPQSTKDGIAAAAFITMLVAEGLAAGTVAATGVGIATFPFYLLLTPIITGDIKVTNLGSRISTATRDDHGWNWTVDPAPVRHKLFKQFSRYIGKDAEALLNSSETNDKE